ncbi:hypothetical protein A5647_11365 [Mycobacterium sp. 1100029.7]|nr:hypothetical protein A5647_11365 [Mycobacterium sp. 1100029.7]
MTQTVNVEYQELMARADEIEAPLPALPAGNPQAPCGLSFVRDAAVQIAINADSLRLYIRAVQREWNSLAKSLRNAAKAYEEVDEGAADDINAVSMDGTSGSSGASLAAAKDDVSMLCDPDEPWSPPPPPPPPPPFQYPYYEVRQAATDIESPDQGTAFKGFASDWNRYQLSFQQLAYRFRPFVNWEGEARDAVEQNFAQQKQWIFGMVTQCTTLARQAQSVADAHKKVRASGSNGWEFYGLEGEHPSAYEVSQCDYWYKYYVQNKSPYLYMAVDWYKKLQTRSETALSTYVSSAGIPLPPLNPTAPYGAYVINPPSPDEDGGTDLPDVPTVPTDPSANMPMMPTMPTLPSAGMGGMPQTPPTPDAQALVDKAVNKAGLPKGGGVKPASLGGGGVGLPKMPLQGAGQGDGSPARPAAAAGPGPATAGLGKGLPGAGGMGGGMGGMPMAGQGDKGGGKGKRIQGADEDSLYTEERPWTEGVIGNRPRKGPADK